MLARARADLAICNGRHIHACTDRNESTAWYGEPLFAYILRTIPACYILS
jgi:hypothetical protein